MSSLRSQPYLPADGVEYLDYMERVINAIALLQREGRVPDDQGVDDLLTLWREVTAQVKIDLAAAGPHSARPITTSIPMTPTQFQQNSGLVDTLYQLLRILEMRGAIDLRRSDGADRVIVAVYNGELI